MSKEKQQTSIQSVPFCRETQIWTKQYLRKALGNVNLNLMIRTNDSKRIITIVSNPESTRVPSNSVSKCNLSKVVFGMCADSHRY